GRVVVDADAGEAVSGRRRVEQERACLGERAAGALALQRVAVADPEPGVGLLHCQPRAVRRVAAATDCLSAGFGLDLTLPLAEEVPRRAGADLRLSEDEPVLAIPHRDADGEGRLAGPQ